MQKTKQGKANIPRNKNEGIYVWLMSLAIKKQNQKATSYFWG